MRIPYFAVCSESPARCASTRAARSVDGAASATGAAITGAAFATDVGLQVGTDGKLIAATTGTPVARSLEAATADGQLVEVLLIPAAKAV